MYPLIRSILFQLDPERAHQMTLGVMRWLGKFPPLWQVVRALYDEAEKPVEVFGLRFKNPVGLAAGYDKDGEAYRGLAALGMGHIEVGTVTPQPQGGNPRPRIFRLPGERALINRMGFPGRGMSHVIRRLEGPRPQDLILGVNIGKNSHTPNRRAVDDYLTLLNGFAPLADYVAINVSSPNTVGLRDLQGRDALEGLLTILVEERDRLAHDLGKALPLLVKLAPDLTEDAFDGALDAIIQAGVDGVIATNTTVERPGLRSPRVEEEGGLSGAPLREMSTRMIQKIHRKTAGQLPIIGVGGILSASDAQAKLEAGASLVQVYTGLVYRGPGLIQDIIRGC